MTDQPVFLYGTLRDPELFAVVADRPLQGRPATLSDHAVNWVKDENFPVISEALGSVALGTLVQADEDQRRRMDFYELGFGYRLEIATVVTENGDVEALVYKPDPNAFVLGELFMLEDWQSRFGELSREAAGDYMSLFERVSATEAARLFPQIKSRAFSRLRAKQSPSPAVFDPPRTLADVVLARAEEPYVDFFALREDLLTHSTFRGGPSPELKRISLVGGDAVTVLPYDPDLDAVLVVRQFRHGPFVRGDTNPWTLEPVAGRIDPGERAEETARRELMEETGLEADGFLRIAGYYPTPGAFSEHITSFIALCDLSGRDGQAGGVASEDEDVMSHVVPFDQLLHLAETGAANTGPLLLSALWLDGRRATLMRPPDQ